MANQIASTQRRRLMQSAPAALLLGTPTLGLLGAPALSLLSACATPAALSSNPPSIPAPAALAPPRVRVGDRWRYLETNRYNGIPTGELTAELMTARPIFRIKLSHSSGKVRSDEVYTDDWRLLEEPNYDAPIAFAQPIPMLNTPLMLGAHEQIRTRYRAVPYEREYFWSMYTDAQAWERIKVPAGEFDCLRISRRIWFSHHDLFRTASERYDTVWYAPQINRWAQREWTGRYITPGGRRGTPTREDWVNWQLLDYIPAPISQS